MPTGIDGGWACTLASTADVFPFDPTRRRQATASEAGAEAARKADARDPEVHAADDDDDDDYAEL